MIQPKTVLNVSDNSGAKSAICIKVLGGYKKRYANAGDFVIVSINSLKHNKSRFISKVRKGDVFKAVVLRTKNNHILSDGSTISFSNNCVSLVTKQGSPLGTRIFGPVLKGFRKKKLSKLLSISSGGI